MINSCFHSKDISILKTKHLNRPQTFKRLTAFMNIDSSERIRINEHTKPIEGYKRNDLYRQFTPVFNTIFSSESLAVEHNNGDAGYVPNRGIEDSIRSFSDAPVNQLNLIVGETGIGKSTYIRKIFLSGLNPIIRDSTLYIPYFLNGKVITNNNFEDVFIRQLRAAYKLCRRTFGVLKEFDHQKIFDFIDEHNAALLEVGDFFDEKSPREVLSQLSQDAPYAFFAEMLKYAAEFTELEKVVVVIDDLEAIDDPLVQHKFIHQACGFHKCLKNVGNRNFSGETVVAMRPFTKKLLKNANWFSAYTPNTIVNISKPVRLAHIFLARFDYILSQGHGSRYVDRERFEEARLVLERVFHRFDTTLLVQIGMLSNYNIRDAITLVGEVISNRRFIQGNIPPREQFKIQNEQFVFNDGNILKSIAFDQYDVYFDHRQFMFNILKNGPNKDTDLVLAYICKYFHSKSSGSWENMEYVELSQFREDISILFNDTDYLDYCIKYMKDEEVVECEEITKGGEKKVYIYAKPKLFGVFELLQVNSVIIDALRDDTYASPQQLEVDGEVSPIIRIKDASQKAVATLQFWQSLVEGEKRLIMRVKPKDTPEFKRKFGDVLVSRMIANGVKNTLTGNVTHHYREYEKIVKKVSEIEEIY